VAIGTLYNHFPARLDLVQEVFAGKLATWVAAAEQALTMDDAWDGLCLFLETMCELQARDRGFNDFASIRLPENACLAGQQTRIHDLGVGIVERAQEQGRLRPDLVPEDLAFVIWSHSRIIEATDGIAPHAWRRHLYLMLDGFRAEHAHPLPEPPLTPQQLYRAMLRLGGADNGTD
jgi:AcrR family transcriptional regulator